MSLSSSTTTIRVMSAPAISAWAECAPQRSASRCHSRESSHIGTGRVRAQMPGFPPEITGTGHGFGTPGYSTWADERTRTMGYGGAITLIVLGLIFLTGVIQFDIPGLNEQALGAILLIAGIALIVLMNTVWRNRGVGA